MGRTQNVLVLSQLVLFRCGVRGHGATSFLALGQC